MEQVAGWLAGRECHNAAEENLFVGRGFGLDSAIRRGSSDRRMDTLTINTLRHWVGVLEEAPEVRLMKVLEMRRRIRRGACEGEHVVDRTVERLAPLLFAVH